MSIPLPSLNLHFGKKTSTTQSSNNDNKDIINLNLYTPNPSTPAPIYTPIEENNNYSTRSRSPSTLSIWQRRESIAPKTYNSPTFEWIETEFKDTLLSFTTDILLEDLDIIKNISEKVNKIILNIAQ
jgi:hypothetical protein